MDITSRRVWGVVLALILFITVCPADSLMGAQKNQLEWEIRVFDDHRIQETVKINDEVDINTENWEQSLIEDGISYSRVVDDWQTYNQLTDKLPVEIKTRNYILWHKTLLLAAPEQIDADSVFAQLRGKQEGTMTIAVPGYIAASSGDRLSESSSVWDLKDLENMATGELILETVTFEGFLIGVTGFLLGLIVIGIVFLRRMKKVEQMMEAEYSLENINLENQPEEPRENEDEDQSWI